MNIMIVGVGGQGTLLASRILGKVAIKEGYDVKVSEVVTIKLSANGIFDSCFEKRIYGHIQGYKSRRNYGT